MRKRVVGRLAGGLLCAALLACIAPAQTPRATTDAIAAALQAHEFDKALELVGPALRQSAQNPELWAMQGTAYAGKGRIKEALASFHSALKISPDYLPALQGAAQIEFQISSPAAIPLLKHLLRLRPSDPTSHGMLAILEYQLGNCSDAVPHFAEAGALFDSKIEALHAYATCLVKLKRYGEAAAVFKKAVSLQPDDRRERQLLASIELMDHKPQDAIASLTPLLQGTPDAGTLDLASAAYEAAKDTERAVSSLRQAILLEPRNTNLYLEFAAMCSAHQSYEVGINVVNDGIGQQPNAAQLYLARGVLYVELGQYDKGEADFEKAYELDPKQSLTSAAQGLAALESNDLDRALTSVQEKLKRTPDDPLLLYVQADILSQKGADPGSAEFETAMRSARKAVSLRPTLSAARGVLAKLYLQTGKYRDAAEQCRKALQSDPKDQTAVYRLIQALRRSGDNKEIPDLLKKLAQLREAAAKEEGQRNRYKLVEDDSAPR